MLADGNLQPPGILKMREEVSEHLLLSGSFSFLFVVYLICDKL